MPCPHGKASPSVCPICQAAPAPALPKITVSGAQPAARTAAQWLQHLRQFAKHFTSHDFKLLATVLDTLAKQGFCAVSEQQFQSTLMSMVMELRRPTLNGKPVRIGIPYRDDGRSTAILEDAKRVREGCMCEVVVLIPKAGLGKWKASDLTGWTGQHDFASLVLDLDKSLRIQGLDGIYVSGGPHDNPHMSGKPKNAAAGTARADEAAQRHAFEEAVILAAVQENLPVLGICGGSWRVAGVLGGEVKRLSVRTEPTHAKSMAEPHKSAHTVEVKPYTMLNQILQTDNYRAWGDPPVAQGTTLHVNSVHWAQSVFPISSPLMPVVSAKAPDQTVEGFEKKPTQSHFVMGIQWHPEYAMDEDFSGGGSQQHRQVMRALGDAARDGKAATILQSHVRGFLARKRAKKAEQVGQ